MRALRRGAEAWICSWDAPHNKSGAAQYVARLLSHAHQSAGPLQPASGCCSSLTPSPVLQSLGLPLSTAMGPCSLGGAQIIWECLPSGWWFEEGPWRSSSWVGSFTWNLEAADDQSLLWLLQKKRWWILMTGISLTFFFLSSVVTLAFSLLRCFQRL